MFSGVYKGKRVLITGHTGFKGSWLTLWLLNLGAEVMGFSVDVPTVPSNFNALELENRILHCQTDIRSRTELQDAIDSFHPEIIFHLAAQSLVRRSYLDPVSTFEVNMLGTLNLLECIRYQPSVRAVVLITSDKCYRNVEWTWGYRENDFLGGDDPYSASKAGAEIITQAYIKSFFNEKGPNVATTRAGNVIGGGDWALDRIVPDTMRSWSQGLPVVIRSPKSTRPWQHVLEPLSGYLWLGVKLLESDPSAVGEAFNFGPSADVNQSVEDLIASLSLYWPKMIWNVEETDNKNKTEATLLKLSCDKALNLLEWKAVLLYEDTIRFTGEWYHHFYNDKKKSIKDLTIQQIEEYQDKASNRRLKWTI